MTTLNIVHDANFYLADGDLAVYSAVSQDDAATVTVFRVHKGILAFHSPVFRDMLALPTHPTGQEMHDGAPLVRVTDTAEELHALLAALYDPG